MTLGGYGCQGPHPLATLAQVQGALLQYVKDTQIIRARPATFDGLRRVLRDGELPCRSTMYRGSTGDRSNPRGDEKYAQGRVVLARSVSTMVASFLRKRLCQPTPQLRDVLRKAPCGHRNN